MPAATQPWPEGGVLSATTGSTTPQRSGYRGPNFSYAPMPDQYTLAAFQRLEHGRRRTAPR